MAKRSKYFATIVYPESAPADWQMRARFYRVPFFCSPLHDKDFADDSKETLKKPHYHILMMYDSLKSQEQAREVFESFGGVGCLIVSSLRGYARYLCHLDDDDKTLYSPDDVYSYMCKYDFALDSDDADYILLKDIMSLIDEKELFSFASLVRYAYREDERVFKYLLQSKQGGVFIREYLKSLSWERNVGATPLRDPASCGLAPVNPFKRSGG